MKTFIYLEKLQSLDTKNLANTMKISSSMARKYKREPWKYDPPTSKALQVEQIHKIPVSFWSKIRIYHKESITSKDPANKGK